MTRLYASISSMRWFRPPIASSPLWTTRSAVRLCGEYVLVDLQEPDLERIVSDLATELLAEGLAVAA